MTGDNGDERARIDRILDIYAKMTRINRIGKLTLLCMSILLVAAIAYGLFG